LAKESRSEDGTIRKLRQAVTAAPVLGTIEIEVSKKIRRQARTTAMTVQSVTVHLQPPERRTDPPQRLDKIAINAVLIRTFGRTKIQQLGLRPGRESPITFVISYPLSLRAIIDGLLGVIPA